MLHLLYQQHGYSLGFWSEAAAAALALMESKGAGRSKEGDLGSGAPGLVWMSTESARIPIRSFGTRRLDTDGRWGKPQPWRRPELPDSAVFFSGLPPEPGARATDAEPPPPTPPPPPPPPPPLLDRLRGELPLFGRAAHTVRSLQARGGRTLLVQRASLAPPYSPSSPGHLRRQWTRPVHSLDRSASAFDCSRANHTSLPEKRRCSDRPHLREPGERKAGRAQFSPTLLLSGFFWSALRRTLKHPLPKPYPGAQAAPDTRYSRPPGGEKKSRGGGAKHEAALRSRGSGAREDHYSDSPVLTIHPSLIAPLSPPPNS